MKSASCRWTCRPNCCACCRRANSSRSAAPARARWTCGSSRPRTATWRHGAGGQIPRGSLLPAERLSAARAARCVNAGGDVRPAGPRVRRAFARGAWAGGSSRCIRDDFDGCRIIVARQRARTPKRHRARHHPFSAADGWTWTARCHARRRGAQTARPHPIGDRRRLLSSTQGARIAWSAPTSSARWPPAAENLRPERGRPPAGPGALPRSARA